MFGRLSWADQQYLHAFFVPAKDLSDDELKAHRLRITAERLSLPHCAGRAVRALEQAREVLKAMALADQRMAKTRRKQQGVRSVQVHGVLRPEPDIAALKRLFIRLAAKELGISSMAISHPDALLEQLPPDGRVIDPELVADPNQRPTHAV